MHYGNLDLPIPYHETFDVLDSSKLSTFQDCPRKFFYRYLLGWESEDPSIHLVFGSAWHEAMEVLFEDGPDYSNERIMEAYSRLESVYRESFPVEAEDESREPKTPQNALDALVSYSERYTPRDTFTTNYVEVAGTVPITRDKLIHFKIDVVVEKDNGDIWIIDHKTTGRKSRSWQEKWDLVIQPWAYIHAAMQLWGVDRVQGMLINGTVFRKTDNEHVRMKVRKTMEDMQVGMWEARHWIQQLDWNMKELEKSSPDDNVMQAFPRNPASCCKFGCQYPEFCKNWANPLARANFDEPPIGFEKEFWDPREREKEAKNLVRLEESEEIQTHD